MQVKLKDVVDYVSDILAYNSASSAADALLAPAADAIAAQLKGARLALDSGLLRLPHGCPLLALLLSEHCCQTIV